MHYNKIILFCEILLPYQKVISGTLLGAISFILHRLNIFKL